MPSKIRIPDGLKRCTSCKENMPLESFARNSAKPDGLQNRCRGCHKISRNSTQSPWCKRCGIALHEYAKDGRMFCGQDCYWAWQDAKVLRLCELCFSPVPKNKTLPSRRFCSRECCAEASRVVITKHCDWCGNEFRNGEFDGVRIRNDRFCGWACSQAWNLHRMTGELNPNYRERVTVQCLHCGTVKFFPPWEADGRKYCNKKCHAAAQSIQMKGDGSPWWRGGSERYYGPNWVKQRFLCKERDGWYCRLCGRKHSRGSHELEAHHIRPLMTFVVEDKLDWESANDLVNLVSVCDYPCHKRMEWVEKQTGIPQLEYLRIFGYTRSLPKPDHVRA